MFLWYLEDHKVKWELEDMLENKGYIFDKLLMWIDQLYIPHYFITSVNLLDISRLHGRDKSLCYAIASIRNDLSNKIQQSQFFMCLEIDRKFVYEDIKNNKLHVMYIYDIVMNIMTKRVWTAIYDGWCVKSDFGDYLHSAIYGV